LRHYLAIGLVPRYSARSCGSDHPGFFVGDTRNFEDLVCYWNLRATDIPLWFVDPNHLTRYTNLIPKFEKISREMVSNRSLEFDRQVGVWFRCEDIRSTEERIEAARKPFGDLDLMACPVSLYHWDRGDDRPPTMCFDEVSALGVIGKEGEKPRVSFPLNEKPFSSDAWFHSQHLVASVSFIGGLYGDEQYTLAAPFVPELNEFYARTMHFDYSKLRIEHERMGLVIEATDKDSSIYALPVADLIEKIFDDAGFSVKLSNGGLILRQLIRQVAGLQGARVFKIPGVRRLFKMHGPTACFRREEALPVIGSIDPDNPSAKFSDHKHLYIEPRKLGSKLEPPAVFSYLVEKGLFRIGRKLSCPACRMQSWIPLDNLKHRVECEMCGHAYDATRQLVDEPWDYRRSGLLGAEKNAQGAIPVALTLQQLQANFHGFRDVYSPSLELEPKGGGAKSEIDFIWISTRSYSERAAVILGECKDAGLIKPEEFEKDINNLKRIADALPEKRFETFVLLAKLAPFTQDEIECAETLNDKYRQRVILLTANELEPYHFYDRFKNQGIRYRGGTPEDLGETTAQLYFRTRNGNTKTAPET
jgi:hypothetical protein